MKTKLMTSFAVLFFGINVSAQELQFSGYYENQLLLQQINSNIVMQDYNKLRFDLNAEISDNLNFSGDLFYQVYHGQNKFNALDFIPNKFDDQFVSKLQHTIRELKYMFSIRKYDRFILDNAFATLYMDWLTLRIGKQQIPWGGGYAWNPTDVFNEKNLLDPTYEKEGINAFKGDVSFSGEGVLSLIMGIEKNHKNPTIAIRIKDHIAGFDISASFVKRTQEGFDYNLFTPLEQRRCMWGADFSGQLLGLGIWAETASNQFAHSADYSQYLAGTDYTFENGLYLMAEYYHNELGKSSRYDYAFNDWMRMLSSDGENLGKDYLYIGEMFPVSELCNWSNYVILNLSDGSSIYMPWFDFSFNDNTEILLIGYVPFGKSLSEYGEFGPGGILRLRVYF